MSKRSTCLLTSVLALTAIILGGFWYRDLRISELERRSAEPGDGQLRAIRVLEGYRGQRAKQRLIWIMQNAVLTHNSIEAMRALARRNEPQIDEVIASNLQPYKGLAVRREAAHLLIELTCSENCVATVLEYLERRTRGERTSELLIRTGNSDAVFVRLEVENRELDNALYNVLAKNRIKVSRVLRWKYGIDSFPTSIFPLRVVKHLSLTESCSDLRQAATLLRQIDILDSDISSTIFSLDAQCESPTHN